MLVALRGVDGGQRSRWQPGLGGMERSGARPGPPHPEAPHPVPRNGHCAEPDSVSLMPQALIRRSGNRGAGSASPALAEGGEASAALDDPLIPARAAPTAPGDVRGDVRMRLTQSTGCGLLLVSSGAAAFAAVRRRKGRKRTICAQMRLRRLAGGVRAVCTPGDRIAPLCRRGT